MKIKYLSVLPIITILVLAGFSLAHAQSDVFTQNLYYGLQNNSQVTQLQEFLTSQGLYSGSITGNFYFLTLDAVKAFQNQQGITPAAGYFGPITIAAADKIADVEVSASNNEAITETGTSTPSVIPASSTGQLELQTLLQELAVLEQQFQAQQSSTQALQNLQTQAQAQTQTLQQIASSTQSIATMPAPIPAQPQSSTPAPTASFTVNGSTNSITIPYDTSVAISWSSTNANFCNISPLGWSGASGNQSTGNLTIAQTYSLSCSGMGGSTSASVTVNVSAAPIPTTLGSIQLTGTNDGTNQFSAGVRDTNVSFFLFDQNGNPITTASATITTDNPLPSGVGWGNNGETEINNSPSGETTFSLAHANISNPSSPASMQHNNGYIFEYTPQTAGQHTITVSALGSTQSVTVTSVPPPPSLPPLLTVSQNTLLATPISVTPSSSDVEIGSYTFKASSAGNVEGMNQVSILIGAGTGTGGANETTDLQNLKLMVNGTQFGSTQNVVADQGTYTFSGGGFGISAGQTTNVSIYADVLSSAQPMSPATSLSGCSGTALPSESGVSCSAIYPSGVAGQNLTVASQ